MEHVSHTANEQIKRLSQNQEISTPTTTHSIPREQHIALFAIINKARMLNGWATRTAQELDPTIRTWSEAFSFYNIPVSAYPELYQRAFDLRQSKMQSTGDAPQMDATLLVSQWTGQHGLQADLKQREVAAGRTLTGNAESVCELCEGYGWVKIDPTDWKSPVKRCTHGN